MAHKILVMDDQSFMVRLIQHHLQRAGYELINAHNREEAEAAIADQSPQLVLMTENAAEQSNIATEANRSSKTLSIPVIRMSDVPATMSAPTTETSDQIIFRTPFSPTKLMAEVKRLLPATPSEPV